MKKSLKPILLLLVIPFLLVLSSCGDDENNGTPVIKDQSFDVPEDTPVGTVIGTVAATDPDSDDLSFSITSQSNEFTIDTSTGDISNVLELDFDQAASYRLTVEASDGFTTSSAIITINIIDSEESNSVTFNGKSYTMNGGIVLDFGPVDYVDDEDPTHYNYDFLVFDGTADFENEEFTGSFGSYLELLSPGTSSFQAGTFSFILPETSDEVDGEFYFSYGDIVVDGNGNQKLLETDEDLEEDLYYIVVGGSVTVTDNGNDNYTLSYDLQVQQVDFESETLIGSVIAFETSVTLDFEYYDLREGRIPDVPKFFEKRK